MVKKIINTIIFVGVGFLFHSSMVYGAVSSLRETPIVQVVRENADAVVNISTERIVYLRENPFWGSYGSEFDLIFEEFFGFNRPSRAISLKSVGSGVVIDKSGIVVTNAHVVNMATNIFIVLNDGTSLEGKVVYENLEGDLALIKVDSAVSLKEIKLGFSGDVMIGETVVAIGNPLGFENSVTAGIISGKNRTIVSDMGKYSFEGLLQIDAPINPGNSGGALINLDSELVGINVAVVQNSQSIGFAIPIEKVRKIMQDYKNKGAFDFRKKKIRNYSRNRKIFIDPSLDKSQDKQGFLEKFFQGGFGGDDDGMMDTGMFDLKMEDKGNEYVVKFNISGLDENKINIQIKGSMIMVSGERSIQTEDRMGDKYYRKQKSFGYFSKSIPLPDDGDVTGLSSHYDDKVLTIRIPKKGNN